MNTTENTTLHDVSESLRRLRSVELMCKQGEQPDALARCDEMTSRFRTRITAAVRALNDELLALEQVVGGPASQALERARKCAEAGKSTLGKKLLLRLLDAGLNREVSIREIVELHPNAIAAQSSSAMLVLADRMLRHCRELVAGHRFPLHITNVHIRNDFGGADRTGAALTYLPGASGAFLNRNRFTVSPVEDESES